MAVSAFNWKQYTEEEIQRRGDPFAEIKRNALISANTTEGVHKLRDKNPGHGTLHGVTKKPLNIKTPEMMRMKPTGGARPNSGRKLPEIDLRRAMFLLEQGMTKRQIAEKFDVPYKSVLTIFKKQGKAPKRGPYKMTGKYKGEAK